MRRRYTVPAPLAAALLLLGLAGTPLAAQEPDTTPALPDPEEAGALPPADSATQGMAPRSGASAQDTVPARPERPPYVPPRYALSMTLGTAGLGTLQRQPVLARRINAAGATLDSTYLSRAIEGGRAVQLSVSALVSLTPSWALRLGAMADRATLRPEFRGGEEDDLFIGAARRLANAQETHVTMLGVEGAIRLRIPASRRAQPYLELGASAVRWDADDALNAAGDLTDGVMRVGGLAGVGILVPFGDRFAARAQAMSHAYRTVLEPASAGTPAGRGRTLSLELVDSPATAFADGAHELTTTIRLELGLSVRLGAALPVPPARSTPPASTSPPGSRGGPGP